MRLRLYTIHSRGRANELIATADQRRWLGLVPPFWALWRGLWLSLLAMLAVIALSALLHPALPVLAWFGLAAICFWEGASLERLEIGLRGWHEVGLVEAGSAAGAEDAYLSGAGR